VVGRAAAVLSLRALLGGAILAVLIAYYASVGRLPDVPLWAAVALAATVLVPTTFVLVLLALPLRELRGLFPVAIAFAVLAVVAELADLDVAANFAKLAAVTLAGFWFLGYFERLSWIAFVAAAVPFVDAVSVWRGPTGHIVAERPEVFGALSFAFPLPGGGLFQLGLTDLLFFALFLGAAARWTGRVGWTWIALVASLGATIVLTVYVDPFGLGGLPALPALSFGFIAANADHLWRLARHRGEPGELVAVSLRPRDAAASARFYRQTLGVHAERRRASPDGDDRGVADELTVYAAWAEHEPRHVSLAFRVTDVEGAHERAVGRGAPVLHRPRDEPAGRTARYADPDGNVVALVESR
jgi:predicted enzyme related to lactoylglutathione lyase